MIGNEAVDYFLNYLIQLKQLNLHDKETCAAWGPEIDEVDELDSFKDIC